MKPLSDSATSAFEQLGYASPSLEAKLLLQTMDGVSTALIKNQVYDREKLRKYIVQKYQ